MIDTVNLPVPLQATKQSYTLRRADERDLEPIMRLLADDPISAGRGDTADDSDRAAYLDAIRELIADTANEILIVEGAKGEALATMQLTRIPGMARRGSTRLLVEAVRVASSQRSNGIGAAMMRWVTGTAAPALGASIVQLTSDAARTDAHRFYERLGFVGSHLGFKFRVE